MADISLETVAGKLNRVGYDAFLQSLRHAKNEGNRNVELSHWLFHIVQNPKSDISATLAHFKLDAAKLNKDLGALIGAGNAALQLGDVNGAVDFFTRAEAIAPNNGDVKVGLATAMLRSE
mgnify:CR=1 FL=1